MQVKRKIIGKFMNINKQLIQKEKSNLSKQDI